MYNKINVQHIQYISGNFDKNIQLLSWFHTYDHIFEPIKLHLKPFTLFIGPVFDDSSKR